MRLYSDGALVKAKALVADARVALAEVLREGSGGIQLRDGKRRLVIQFEGEFLFLDVSDYGDISHGTTIDETQAMNALPAFFERGIPGPNGTKIILSADSFVDFIARNAALVGCPICRMAGWDH